MARTLRRVRQRNGVSDLVPFRTSTHGEEFLRYDEHGMMIFATPGDLHFLAESHHWFGDGTFKVTPSEFKQQYTIHAYYDGMTYPCVYALLPGKSEVVYNKMLDIIVGLIPLGVTASPTSIMTDFEKAAMNAFKRKFCNAEISGCYFHLGQSAWRRIQNDKLSEKYKDDPAFAIRVRRFLALAFVPPNELHHYMQLLLVDEISRPDGLLVDFMTYFQKTYVGQLINGVEIPGTFPYQMWNMYQRVKDRLPRTNNSLEGWHNAFARDLPLHPPIPTLAKKYQTEQHKKAMNRRHHVEGRTRPKAKKLYQRVTKYLESQVNKLDSQILVNLVYLEQTARVMEICSRDD